jgi:hypothetical protein
VQSVALWGGSGNNMRAELRPGPLQNKRVVVFAFTIRLLISGEWDRMDLGAVPQ